MLTLLLIFWPLVSILLVMLFGGRNAKWLAFISSLVSFGLTIGALCAFNACSGAEAAACSSPGTWCDLSFSASWMSKFDINFAVDIDGISMMMVLLTNLLCPLIFLSAFRYNYEKPVLFYSMALMMQSALVGVFTASDIFLYYIFWELALIPIYIIVLKYGGVNKERITFKFFIYTLIGSLLMLLAIIFLKGRGYMPDNRMAEDLVFWAFMLAFAIKIPIFPLHTWQPDTYTTAPPQGTMLLSGIMLKMGLYSIIRWIIPVMPEAVDRFDKPIIILAIAGIIYASWIAITRRDLKRLFAYSSIAHVGLIAAGLFTLTPQALQGGMIQMLTHGINVVGLFFVAQIIFDRTKTHDLPTLGGIINQAPVFATFFMIIMFGSVALPLTNGFVGEFLLLQGLYQYSPWAAAFAGLTVIFGAIYMLRAYQQSMLGEVKPGAPEFKDLYASEAIVMAAIAGLVLFIGIYPKPFMELTEPAVNDLLQSISSQSIIEY